MKTNIIATAALIFGFVLGAFSAAQANKPESQPIIQTYDCDTLQDIPNEYYFDPSAAHQIQKLHDQCQQQRNALLLQKTWDKDPTAGIVLEKE